MIMEMIDLTHACCELLCLIIYIAMLVSSAERKGGEGGQREVMSGMMKGVIGMETFGSERSPHAGAIILLLTLTLSKASPQRE